MIRSATAIACALLVAAAPLDAAPQRRGAAATTAATDWAGAWGYVISPPAPGQPATSSNAPQGGPAIPLGPPANAAPPPFAPRAIDNPGNVPVDTNNADLVNVTVRQVVRVSAAGSAVRLRFSNEGGTEVLPLGAVRVGMAGPDGSVMPGTERVVTFAGLPGTNIPAGSPLLSDPVALPVKALDRLAVSLYAPGRLPVRNVRALWQYVAGPKGDSTAAPVLPEVRLASVPVILTQVEVAATQPTGVVVALGDSITEGFGATSNGFRTWPDRLAERLARRPGRQRWAVTNAGIGGNRLLTYGAGPNALARFDRDVLGTPGVKVVVLLEGINDIGRSFSPRNPSDPVTADTLIAADRQIIARAHAHGIRVIGATLTPYMGAGYASEPGEAVRQALNTWIRTSGEFDGVIDFDRAVGDKADPLKIAPAFHIGDSLHPNDAGYQAMADAIDLSLLTGR